MDQASYVREIMRALLPVATGMVPKLPEIPGIAAVVFDIYGTLIISAAGDIGTAREEISEAAMKSAFAASGVADGGGAFAGVYEETVKRHQAFGRARGVRFPEVEIRDVWAEMMETFAGSPFDVRVVEEVALRYECEVNPVWAMPRAGEVLEVLRRAGLKSGIVSNAQFYTLSVMEGLFGATLDHLGFDPRLQVFSFEEGEGKPSRRLFEVLAERAKAIRLEPSQIFYLGNDMKKDVLPARDLGFRTGLFAGDARSLRLGGQSPEEAAETADAVITDLAQLPALFHIPS